MYRLSAALLLSLLIQLAARAQSPAPYQAPSLSKTQVAFLYAGDIWVVGRNGGEARRLLSSPGEKSRPVFSPDGSQVAFSMVANGNWDVYVVAAAGGAARRLTFHPKEDLARGWTPDGKRILFASRRIDDGFERLYTIAADGGFETELPLPTGEDGAFSPDGARLAYSPVWSFGSWRNYRGGHTTPIWIANLADSQVEELPRNNSNDRDPSWVGNNIYFISDRTGTANLFAFDTRTKKVTQLTSYEKYDVRSAAASDDAVVFTQRGAIRLLDLKTNQVRDLDVRVGGEFPETKPRAVKAQRFIRGYDLSPAGDQVIFEARGELLVASADGKESRNLTRTPGVAERSPAWSPDGKYVAYFSDESGEYQLHIRTVGGEGNVKKITIESQPAFYNELVWSPDSKKLAFSSLRLTLWAVDVDRGVPTPVDVSSFAGQGGFEPSWSPDSRWLAYAKAGANHLSGVFLYSLESNKKVQVTGAKVDAEFPAFDRAGKYLFFLSSANAGPSKIFGMSAFPFRASMTRSLNAVVLQKDEPSPLLPAARDAAKKEASASGIDIEGIGQRVVRLPIPARDYIAMAAGKAGVVYLLEREWGGALSGEAPPSRTLHRFDLGARKFEKFLEAINGFAVSADGSRLAYRKGEGFAVVGADAPAKAGEGRLDLSKLEIEVVPRQEWAQMFNEVWRIVRDYFYDSAYFGQDLAALKQNYAAYLPNVASRQDLNSVFREMLSHLSISHVSVGGGDMPDEGSANIGMLGADFNVEQGRYRIARIYRGDNSHPLLTAPLDQPGVNVSEGDYLLEVDGQAIEASKNLFAYFEGKAGRPTQIKVGPSRDGSGSRVVTVMPLRGENTLRRFNWAEENRRTVERLSGGRLAYVYLSNTGSPGYSAFNQEFYTGLDKQGLIVDERYNSGGAPADYIIETLRREPLSYYAFRYGADFPFPTGVLMGPKVMVINEFAGSGGDTLPWMFRAARLGPLVGKRTMGAGIGGFLDIPALIDGGEVAVPNRAFYNPKKGAFDIENHGVDPDVEVEYSPAAVRAGHDPQLERAVQVALQELKKNPRPSPLRPKSSVYK